MKKKLMRRFCILGVYCLCVLLMLIVSGVGGKAEQTAAISANDCYENRIAITFDDGPGKGTTEKLLDGLKERGVKATFFLVGEKIEDNRELVARMYAEGHLIGNHTFTHVQLSKVDGKQALEEIVKTNTLIEEITGEPVRYIRPPYGSYSNSLLMQINMTPVLWSVDPEDWNTDNSDTVDCFEDIQMILDASQDKVTFDRILISQNRLSYILRNKKMKLVIFGQDKSSTPLLLSNLNEFMRQNGFPIFEVIRRTTRIQNNGKLTEYSPWNDKNLVFIPAGKLGVIKNAYADNELRQEPGVTYSNYGRIRVSQWGKGETDNSNGVEFTKAQSLSLPIITEINGIYSLTVEK